MIAPSYRLIAPVANRSFTFKWEAFDLSTRWHYHPELELIYFIKGSTSAIIGDGFEQFEEGELVLLGANFPHVLQENSDYKRNHPSVKPFGLIIQFREDFLGAEFLSRPETKGLQRLFYAARSGLRFRKRAIQQVAPLLLQMQGLDDTRKLLMLLQILHTLSESRSFEKLLPAPVSPDVAQDEDRMHAIHQYVYKHFKKPITVADAAAVANLTETSFCRYFKSRTLKTFTRFLNETRVAYACRLLNKSSYTITEVCYQSGFTNLSYFNRQFKKQMQLSPQQYQKWKAAATQ